MKKTATYCKKSEKKMVSRNVLNAEKNGLLNKLNIKKFIDHKISLKQQRKT